MRGDLAVCTRRYGIIILIIEIAGASTVILYGTNLLFNPVVDPLIEDPENPGELRAS